jgi:hypothetical protein
LLCVIRVKQYDIKAESHHDDADIFGLARGNLPVVEVVVQLAIADLEHEVFKHALVLAHLSHIKDIEAILLRHDECILEQGFQALLRVAFCHTVRGVRNVDFGVLGVV